MTDELAKVEMQPPAIAHGQEIQSIFALAKAAKMMAVPTRDPREILEDCKKIGRMMAEKAYYSIPFKNKRGEVNYVEGPTTDLAEAVVQAHGNMLYGSVLDRQDDHAFYLVAFVMRADRAVERVYPFRQPKATPATEVAFKNDPDRAQQITLAIGDAKATRNAVGKALGFYLKAAFEAAKEAAQEKKKKRQAVPTVEKFGQLFERAARLGISDDQMWHFLAKEGRIDPNLPLTKQKTLSWDDYDRATNVFTAIEEGSVQKEQVFPATEPTTDLAPGAE